MELRELCGIIYRRQEGAYVSAEPVRFRPMIDSKRFYMLPKIKDGVINSIKRSSREKDYIRDGWAEMMTSDKMLFSCLTKTCQQMPTREMKEGFLRGAWLVWALYKSQDEADEMNKDWGL